MNYRSEIAELARFFGTYASFVNKYAKISFDDFVDVGYKILEPVSDKTYSLLHRDISVIDVDYGFFEIYMKAHSGQALYINISEGYIRVFAINKQEKYINEILHIDMYKFKGIFIFFLNYNLLYNIAPPRTKDALQHIYNEMTGGIK